jgi:Uma2 family endonuclease
MNEHVPLPQSKTGAAISPAARPPTQAAEGVPRWRWTTAELIHLTDLGIFTAEDRLELIGGEIVPMSPVGRRHEVVADELHQYWRSFLTSDIWVTTERQFNLDDETYCKPDIWVRPVTIKAPDVRGNTVLLIVEVAQTSLKFDTGTKAALYAKHGVREYWVINAETLETKVHRVPGATGYGETRMVAASEQLVSLLVPLLAVRIADLNLGD